MWNLVNNAVKFTPKGGRIQVALERIESHIEITVSDNGQGIPPELLPTIFERFRQGDASTTRKEGGLGLGLAIAKQIVELHGGTIHAESEPARGKAPPFACGSRCHRSVAKPAGRRHSYAIGLEAGL